MTDYVQEPLAVYILAFVFIVLLALTGSYVVLFPFASKHKHNSKIAHLILTVVIALYVACLASTLILIAPNIPIRYLHEIGVLVGNVGVTFGVLIVYDNMKGTPIKDVYNELLNDLTIIEQDTSCAIQP